MKEYQIDIQRTYTTTIILRFPNDGRDHKAIIDKNISEGEEMVWDLISEKELDQMDITDESWEIEEKNNTRTGALSNDTGPRNKITMEEVIGKLTTLIRDELAESQVNKENNTAEYLLGKNEAYVKVLSLITKSLTNGNKITN